MYPIIKNEQCIGCDRLIECKEIKRLIKKDLNCTDAEIPDVLLQMIPIKLFSELSSTDISCENEEPFELSIPGINEEKEYQQRLISDLNERLYELLDHLKPREKEIVILRYGLTGRRPQTLEEVGEKYHLTRERIRQLEKSALKKLHALASGTSIKDYFHC